MDKKILCAEDEFTNLKLHEIHFQNAGFECDLAVTGKDAAALLENNNYVLVILDEHMPDQSGSEIAELIRGTGNSVPIIGITSDDQVVDTLLRKGFNEVLVKPVRGEDYKRIIDSYLSSQS
ncbi:MAG: response regulator [Spirochaetales bacterium]|nr:response regulator [Spirochaetales bacterium]MCF7937367.1 response regulator [Spirochaetales bacterium]